MSNRVRLPVSSENERLVDDEVAFVNQSVEASIVDSQKIDKVDYKSRCNELEVTVINYEKEILKLNDMLSVQHDFDELNTLLSRIYESIDSSFNAYQSQVADVVIASVVKILGDTLIRPEVALSVVKKIINSENESQISRVFVSPSDYVLIEKYKNKLKIKESIVFEPDEKIKTGGCILELPVGSVDGRIDVQLKTLYSLLTRA